MNVFGLLARPVHTRYRSLVSRISTLEQRTSCLETAIDCLVETPTWLESEASGFNGQRQRKIIVQEILGAIEFDLVIETGTFLGDTTGYLSRISGLPVYTCELNERISSLARMRLRGIPNIIFAVSDSRALLQAMAASGDAEKRALMYLDAHWYDDLPLREELEAICSGWRDFVIVVDDFQVPDDAGYGYDDYGEGRTLSLDSFSSTFAQCELISFFPAVASGEESGARRGCVVLAKRSELVERLGSVRSLRRFDY